VTVTVTVTIYSVTVTVTMTVGKGREAWERGSEEKRKGEGKGERGTRSLYSCINLKTVTKHSVLTKNVPSSRRFNIAAARD